MEYSKEMLEAIDVLYFVYVSEIEFEMLIYNHPSSWNGTVYEDKNHIPKKPDDPISKEEFTDMLNSGSNEALKWEKALIVALRLITKGYNGKQ